ncbi:MAG: hypothetical protein ACPGF7_13705 [Pontibacterium sp.]
MATNLDSLIFDIDIDDLTDLQELYEATEGQLIAAYNRSLTRTAVTLKKLGGQLIRDEVKARNLKAIRRRLQQYKIKSRGLSELKLWFGLNDLPVSALKGRMSSSGNDATFAAASSGVGTQRFTGGFVGNVRGRKSIYSRIGKERFPVKEAAVSIKHLQEAIEDDVFDQLPDIFMKYLESDLKGRVKQGMTNSYYEKKYGL